MKQRQLDVAKLAALIDRQRAQEHLTFRDVARQTGLSPSTICRIGQGKRPDADALLTLLDWLRVPAGAVCADVAEVVTY